jgi:hypothetical protein
MCEDQKCDTGEKVDGDTFMNGGSIFIGRDGLRAGYIKSRPARARVKIEGTLRPYTDQTYVEMLKCMTCADSPTVTTFSKIVKGSVAEPVSEVVCLVCDTNLQIINRRILNATREHVMEIFDI